MNYKCNLLIIFSIFVLQLIAKPIINNNNVVVVVVDDDNKNKIIDDMATKNDINRNSGEFIEINQTIPFPYEDIEDIIDDEYRVREKKSSKLLQVFINYFLLVLLVYMYISKTIYYLISIYLTYTTT